MDEKERARMHVYAMQAAVAAAVGIGVDLGKKGMLEQEVLVRNELAKINYENTFRTLAASVLGEDSESWHNDDLKALVGPFEVSIRSHVSNQLALKVDVQMTGEETVH